MSTRIPGYDIDAKGKLVAKPRHESVSAKIKRGKKGKRRLISRAKAMALAQRR